MASSHVQGNLRACSGLTIAAGQSFVFVNGKAWAVEGDKNTHGLGKLIASKRYVQINGKSVIIKGDQATPDLLCPSLGGSHCVPSAATGDSLVQVE
jgi:uncharacterized Zn-binding protein involved in type VI secretion